VAYFFPSIWPNFRLALTPWILTYDDADEIREIYSNYDVPYIMKRIKYSAARKRYETELLFFNNLIIPFQGKDGDMLMLP